MKKYAIWKDHKVIGYVDMPEESAKQLNGIKGIGIYNIMVKIMIL